MHLQNILWSTIISSLFKENLAWYKTISIILINILWALHRKQLALDVFFFFLKEYTKLYFYNIKALGKILREGTNKKIPYIFMEWINIAHTRVKYVILTEYSTGYLVLVLGRIPDIWPWFWAGYRISGLGAWQDTGYPALVLDRKLYIQPWGSTGCRISGFGARQDTGYQALVG